MFSCIVMESFAVEGIYIPLGSDNLGNSFLKLLHGEVVSLYAYGGLHRSSLHLFLFIILWVGFPDFAAVNQTFIIHLFQDLIHSFMPRFDLSYGS